jgi:hypothetical protein
MSPLEQLLTELVPSRPAPVVHNRPWTPEERDAHWEDLCNTMGAPGTPRPSRPAATPDEALPRAA